ncbi:MAG: hypothetical protein IKR32_01730, partial [Bacteroidales bacterium]|nr:hypothetical protein [Bacteroidales bacterium]
SDEGIWQILTSDREWISVTLEKGKQTLLNYNLMKEKERYFSPDTVVIKLRTEGVMCASEPIDNALGVGTDMFNYGEGTEQNW